MEKRFAENTNRSLMKAVGSAIDHQFSAESLDEVARGADERDLVYSGLDETMTIAYRQIRAERRRHDDHIDLRTAAFIVAIKKIASAYRHQGIFP